MQIDTFEPRNEHALLLILNMFNAAHPCLGRSLGDIMSLIRDSELIKFALPPYSLVYSIFTCILEPFLRFSRHLLLPLLHDSL